MCKVDPKVLVRRIGQCHTAHLLDWVTNDTLMLQGTFIICSQSRGDRHKDITIEIVYIKSFVQNNQI